MIPPNSDAQLWLFDFDNTLAALEREVDWPGGRRELEAALRAMGVEAKIFVDTICQIQKALAQRPSASKRLERICCKLRPQPNAR